MSIPSITSAMFGLSCQMVSLNWPPRLIFLSKVFRWFFISYWGLPPLASLSWCTQGCAQESLRINGILTCIDDISAILAFPIRPIEIMRYFHSIMTAHACVDINEALLTKIASKPALSQIYSSTFSSAKDSHYSMNSRLTTSM